MDRNNIAFEIKNISTSFASDGKRVTAVDDVSVYVKRGEIVGLVGESGSGKSVTMLSSLQLVFSPGRVDKGEVYIGDCPDNILAYKQHGPEIQAVRGGKIGMIFQEPMTSLDPVFTIGDQISEAILTHLPLSKKEAKAKAIELLAAVGIPDAETRYDYYPQQFSGGMRQRIMIAMALSADPDILIADEATTALDVTTQSQLLEMLNDLSKERGIAIVIVTHNLGIVARYADRIYVMYSGQVMEEADTRTLFKTPGHPYTLALLKAIPSLEDSKERVLIPIEGLAPTPATRPPYCPFYDRCEYACEGCKHGRNELREVAEGHFVSCFRSQEEIREITEELKNKSEKEAPKKVISEEKIVDVEDLVMSFPSSKKLFGKKEKDLVILDHVSVFARKGETLGIVGESGCGKTTLARCIMRAYKPTSGKIVFDGQEIQSLSEKKLSPIRPRIAMIFQDPFSSLDPRQSVGSIVGEGLIVNKLVKTVEEYNNRVDELFRLVGLDPAMKERAPHEFSGGQRQRIGIASALASNPDVIVCDEPISALDVSIQAQIINLLEELQSKLQITFLFIAHDLAVVKHISDRIAVMYLGNVLEVADCDELYNDPKHPYTKALLSAVPVTDPELDASRERIRLTGEVPSINKRPEGCPFYDRCEHCTSRCKTEKPGLTTLDKKHQVACFLYQ